MKVIAFNGSPRKGGNTEFLLKEVLKVAEGAGIETELVQVGGKPLRGCTACFKCIEKKNSRCSVEGDILNECLAKMIDADAIVLGSPSYFADMTSETKALIDRSGFVARANGGLFRRKIGAAVIAQRRGGAVNVLDSINHMFLMSEMIVPGSTYWNFGVGAKKGEVKDDQEALANMQNLGETIVWLIKNIHSDK